MRNIIINTSYHDAPLIQSHKNCHGYYGEVLDAIKVQMGDMIQRHSKAFLTMFILRYPADSYLLYPKDNSLLSRFLEALTTNYKRNGLDPHYLWVRELSPSTGQVHYHMMLLLNGHLTQRGYGHLDKATELWGRSLGIANAQGLVELRRSDLYDNGYGGVMIKRNDANFQQVYGHCSEWASYLAKVYSKEGLPPNVNGYGCSRIG